MEESPSKLVNNPENYVKFQTKESFDVIAGNKHYELILGYNKLLMYFQINEKNTAIEESYNLYAGLGELGDINIFFWKFKNLKEVFDSLKSIIDKKNLIIIKEEKKMKIKLINPENNEEFYINVLLKEKDIEKELINIKAKELYESSLDHPKPYNPRHKYKYKCICF